MNAQLVIAQIQTYMQDVPIILVQSLMQELLSKHNNKGVIEFVSISGIPDDTYICSIPDGVMTVLKAYYNGYPVSMDYTEEEYLDPNSVKALTYTEYRAVSGPDRYIRMNFAVNTAGSTYDLIIKALKRGLYTIKTLPDEFDTAMLFYVLYRICQLKQFKDDVLAKNYFIMFEDAYESVSHNKPGVPFRSIV